MGAALGRTAYSPNIKERRDFSCAVFDRHAELVAQAAHIPVHLGAMPLSVRAAINRFPHLGDGDIVVLNDPYEGGSHLPDITMVSPVFCSLDAGALLGYVASRAHHADVGGMTPGSMPLAQELHQEGLIIPPVLLQREGVLDQGVLDLIMRNSRTPEERLGDLTAQISAQRLGSRRVEELATRYGRERARGVHGASAGLRRDRGARAPDREHAARALHFLGLDGRRRLREHRHSNSCSD